MTNQEKDRIESAIHHIESSLDVDPWACEIAVNAMRAQLSEDPDCISRQAAIDVLKALEEPAPTAQHVSAIFDCEDAIRDMPSAQLDVIRCRDCQYFDGTHCYCLDGNGMIMPNQDDFCSYAERIENG